MSLASWANVLADVALAGAALWVSGTATKGWLKERSANASKSLDDRQAHEADARLHYLSASLQNPRILLLILLGSAVKIIIVLTPAATLLWTTATALLSA